MVSNYLVFLALSLFFALAASLPAPQTSDLEDKIDSFNDDEDDDYYGDYDEVSAAVTPTEDKGLEDLLKLGAGLAEGFLALLGEKVKFINGLLADKELRDQVGNTVAAGLNLTGQIARAAAPVVQAAVQSVPIILASGRMALENLNSEEHQQRTRQVAEGVGQAASQVPELLNQGSRLISSVVRAANDTAPLILNGIQEFTDQLPLITSFASAYAEVNAEQAQEVAQTFYTSLQCDLQCRDVVDKDLKQECLVQFCAKKGEEDEV